MRRFVAVNRHAFNTRVDIRGTIYEISGAGILEVSDEHAKLVKTFKEFNELLDQPVSPNKPAVAVDIDVGDSAPAPAAEVEPAAPSDRYLEIKALQPMQLMRLARSHKVRIANRDNSEIIADILSAEEKQKAAEAAASAETKE